MSEDQQPPKKMRGLPGDGTPGPGRAKGSMARVNRDMRTLMEELEELDEMNDSKDLKKPRLPIPVILLKLGLRYHAIGLHADAVNAIGKAIPYAYPSLKSVEISGPDKGPMTNVVVYAPDNSRGPKPAGGGK